MSLPLLPGLQRCRHPKAATTGGVWSGLRGTDEEAEGEVELHEPTEQEMLQYEFMMLRLDPKYEAKRKNAMRHREIALAVVRRNGYALFYASKELQNDKEVVMAAVKQSSYLIAYASKELQKDEDVLRAAGKL